MATEDKMVTETEVTVEGEDGTAIAGKLVREWRTFTPEFREKFRAWVDDMEKTCAELRARHPEVAEEFGDEATVEECDMDVYRGWLGDGEYPVRLYVGPA